MEIYSVGVKVSKWLLIYRVPFGRERCLDTLPLLHTSSSYRDALS